MIVIETKIQFATYTATVRHMFHLTLTHAHITILPSHHYLLPGCLIQEHRKNRLLTKTAAHDDVIPSHHYQPHHQSVAHRHYGHITYRTVPFSIARMSTEISLLLHVLKTK